MRFVASTLSFRTSRKRARHFQDHGADFGAITAEEYEEMASTFLENGLQINCEEYTRLRDRARLRFNLITEEFGILSSDGYIRTYYIPNPLTHHGEPINYDYYLNCANR